MVGLVKEMQKVERHIMSSGCEQQLAHTRLDVLAQRANYELCMDQVCLSLSSLLVSLPVCLVCMSLALSHPIIVSW